MRLKNEEAHRHWTVRLLKNGMMPAEEFTQFDDVVVTLPHLLAVDGDHVIVQPIPRRDLMIAHGTLRDLTLMMRELQVHATAMDVEPLTEILGAHGRALNVPTRKTHAPGTFPLHDVFRCGMLPEREVAFVALFVLCGQCPGRLQLIVQHTTTQHTIRHAFVLEIPMIFLHVEIDRSVNDIGISVCNDPLDHHDLLHNMAGRRRFDARFQIVELMHRPMKHIGVLLHQFHRFELFQHRL